MAKADTHDDIKKMSFEKAMAELEAIVERLESGDAKLDDAIGAYERGAALKQHCEARLREAQDKVEKIRLAADGTVSAEPTEIE
ncbi:MAG: exodeoxyribonuclease VII small subunit [Rhodospirillales bacterium]|nr:exodeoxyribonuclease VII small subunit [Rhodospirillales bacterium]